MLEQKGKLVNKILFSIYFPSEKTSICKTLTNANYFHKVFSVTKINWVRISIELKMGLKSLER